MRTLTNDPQAARKARVNANRSRTRRDTRNTQRDMRGYVGRVNSQTLDNWE